LDVISDGVGGTTQGMLPFTRQQGYFHKKEEKKKYIKMKDFIITVHITNPTGFRGLNSLSNIFTKIGFYFEAFTVIMVAYFKW
jgi:hypothetical protein